MATLNSLTISMLCEYVPGTYRGFVCATLGTLGAIPFSSTNPVILNNNNAFSLQIQSGPTTSFYAPLATQLANLISGTWFVNFQLFGTLGGTSVPFDEFRIYGTWACAGFDDGSFLVYRPTTFQTIAPGLPNSVIVNPGNMVDGDFSTFGSVEQIQYAFGGGAAAVVGVTSFALSTAPATTWTANTVQISGSSVIDASGHIQIATGSGGITGATVPAWNDSGGTTNDGTVVWADGGSTACNISPPSSALAITCGSPPSATVGDSYSHTFTATGGSAPYTYSVLSGTIPTGASLNSSTGLLSGTVTTAGTFIFKIQVTDALAATADTGNCSIVISAGSGLTANCNNPPDGTVGLVYTHTFTGTSGTPPYTFALAFGTTLPPGLSLASNGDVTGTPTTAGFYQFSVQITDNVAATNVVNCSITILSGRPFGLFVYGVKRRKIIA